MYTKRTEYSLIFVVCFNLLYENSKKSQQQQQLNKIDETEQKIIQNQRDPMLHDEKRQLFKKKKLNEIYFSK